ncbi:MAG TPA: hypothetical protein PK264_10580 [Hyphomicrobiaceae bacterium]|nr:hypothetical protein [Hyphomicrobiaceae bacterium]
MMLRRDSTYRQPGLSAEIAARLMQAIAALVICALACLPAIALDIEFGGRRIKREILALYDGRHGPLNETRIHKFAEMPLNHLGFKVIYHDISKGLPPIAEMGRYRGVLTWFLEPLPQPDQLVFWLDQVTRTELSYVMIGEVAPPSPEALEPTVARILARLGLHTSGQFIGLTHRSKVVFADPDMLGFERRIDAVLPGYLVVTAKANEATAHLTLRHSSPRGEVSSDVVATSPRGGYAPHDFTIFYEPNTNRVRWILNPFAFFKKAFGNELFPVPDTTTLAGRRLYFSHIDGDGWNNLTDVEEYRVQNMLSAEVIARDAILPFPDLPVSVGLIAGEADRTLGGLSSSGRIARLLYALPHVEVASHTYSHPYSWRFFEAYERTKELDLIEKAARPEQPVRERLAEGLMRAVGREPPPSRYDKFFAGSDELPRTFMKRPFDLKTEVAGALAMSESFAPKGKKAKLYLWSGDTTPFEGAIREVRLAGARNINGGDSRLDIEYPSVAYVPPISRVVGSERHIYAVNSNENTYTNDWTGPYYGFFMLEHTLRNTDAPRRLKAFNLYYHMYSGEKSAALASVRHFLAMARRQPVIPIAASHYTMIAEDFFAAEIEQVNLSAWAVTARGTMQTVRFDDAEGFGIDWAQSIGVIGFTRHQKALYISLDAQVTRAIVALQARSDPDRRDEATPRLVLEGSRWQIRAISQTTSEVCDLIATVEGFGPGDMVWRAPPGKSITATIARGGEPLAAQTATVRPDGLVELRLAAAVIEPAMLRLKCHG